MPKIDCEVLGATLSSRPSEPEPISTLSLGEFACQTIQAQFDYILAQEQGVIADQDPEYLHQMRVGFRRFQAAITVFQPAIALPKKLQWKKIKPILRVLGKLRDLDVQLMDLEQKLKQSSMPGDQQNLVRLRRDLKHQRHDAYQRVAKLLQKKTAYRTFRRDMGHWLESPRYRDIADSSLELCLPELLTPLLAKFLLHPAWHLSEIDILGGIQEPLHDLRKLCKQVRYQSEFFIPYYPKELKDWVKQVKTIQSRLGDMQDAVVFEHFIRQYQNGHYRIPSSLPVPKQWDQLRSPYTDLAYRRQLYGLILHPAF